MKELQKTKNDSETIKGLHSIIEYSNLLIRLYRYLDTLGCFFYSILQIDSCDKETEFIFQDFFISIKGPFHEQVDDYETLKISLYDHNSEKYLIDSATIKNYQLIHYIKQIFRRKAIKAYLGKSKE